MIGFPTASAPMLNGSAMGTEWWRYFFGLDQMFRKGIEIPQVSVADLTATPPDGRLVFVPDASPDPCLAVSIGGQWLKLKTDGVVS